MAANAREEDTDAPHGMLPLLDDEDLDGPDAVSLTALYLCSVCPEGHADELLAAVQDTTCKAKLSSDVALLQRVLSLEPGQTSQAACASLPCDGRKHPAADQAAQPTQGSLPTEPPAPSSSSGKRDALEKITNQAEAIMTQLSQRASCPLTPAPAVTLDQAPPAAPATLQPQPSFTPVAEAKVDSQMLSTLNLQIEQLKTQVARAGHKPEVSKPSTISGQTATDAANPALHATSVEVERLRQQAMEMLVALRTPLKGEAQPTLASAAPLHWPSCAGTPTAVLVPESKSASTNRVAPGAPDTDKPASSQSAGQLDLPKLQRLDASSPAVPFKGIVEPLPSAVTTKLHDAMLQLADLRVKAALRKQPRMADGTIMVPSPAAVAPGYLQDLRMQAMQLLSTPHSEQRQQGAGIFPARLNKHALAASLLQFAGVDTPGNPHEQASKHGSSAGGTSQASVPSPRQSSSNVRGPSAGGQAMGTAPGGARPWTAADL